ncbi:RDD family protein [Stenotrophomonas maltophilia]|uniref:RDD family protein n=1 Tax=Stenotrophomonas TaxID=40323 RepID=UPI0013102E57|nr:MULTISPECIES: RDD family protein [Stenotrophomonas]ELC7323359.1 RDD family protein [Stenotrophomonas maltophilia]MBA0276702.1 RDD family protein [Stenotrophomonas maltophilia]MBA0413550.1 RDD family protein [Stenotrophomonas maltophilia]MBA0498807.1 RDD family protein [Stenotrophomonas maltophilia]MBA0502336.1 RDD family protein [Stenotrophomonas maltophilia]
MSRPVTETAPAAASELPRPRALLLWRLLAMVYDALPVLALWMLAGTLFTLAYTISGHAQRENIAPFSAWQWLLWAVCWGTTGWYATASWRRGGQTLGMRPWRLKLQSNDGTPLRRGQLWLRFAVGTLSLLLGGLGFWWAWFDRERLTWHDRASGTRLARTPKR